MTRLLPFLCLALALPAARTETVKGFQPEYLDDFAATSKQLLQLADATPAEKYGWRPAAGVRSISEVYVHIATGNLLLLSLTGVDLPPELYPKQAGRPDVKPMEIYRRNLELEKAVSNKDQVVTMLRASLDAVRDHFSKLSPADLDKPADFFGQQTTVRRIYLRIFAHANEHMGQSIAYARVNGIVPPWSRKQAGK